MISEVDHIKPIEPIKKVNTDDLSHEEQMTLLTKIADLAIKHGILEYKPYFIELFSATQSAGNYVNKRLQTQLRLKQTIYTSSEQDVKNFQKDVEEQILVGIDKSNVRLELKSQIGPGCVFAPIDNLVDIFTCEEVSIFHKPGQILLIILWIKDSNTCQGLLRDFTKIMDEHSSKWGKKFRFVCINYDENVRDVALLLSDKGWHNLEHYHNANTNLHQDYAISEVPYALLVDTDGKILQIGDTRERKDFANDILRFVEGEKFDNSAYDVFTQFKVMDQSIDYMKLFREESVKEIQYQIDQENFKEITQFQMSLRKDIIYDIQEQKFKSCFESNNSFTAPKHLVTETKSVIESLINKLNLPVDKPQINFKIPEKKKAYRDII